MARPEQEQHLDFSSLGEISIAVVSDTHGYLDHRVREVVGRCDIALHAGDIFHGDVLRAMQPKTGKVISVRGNNDIRIKWNQDDHEMLEQLPDIVHIELTGGRLTMEHGHRIWDTRNYHRRLRDKHPQSRVIVYGHTHIHCIDQCDVPWVVNPGAAGRIRTHGGASCLEIQVSKFRWKAMEYKFALEPLSEAG